MKITDIIRGVLDIIDCADAEKPQEPAVSISIATPITPPEQDQEELARMQQLAGLLPSGAKEYSNSPEERVAGIDAVTASGTDLMKSKHPADIRTDAPSMYPGAQWKGQ